MVAIFCSKRSRHHKAAATLFVVLPLTAMLLSPSLIRTAMQYAATLLSLTLIYSELFGDSRLLDAMNRAETRDPEKLLEHLRCEIDAFVKEAPQFDDITMLALRVNDGTQRPQK